MTTKRIQPDGLFQRALKGHTLYSHVVVASYVTDIDEFFKHPAARAEIFGQALPTSTTVEVRRLSHPDMMVEIEAMAVVDNVEAAS